MLHKGGMVLHKGGMSVVQALHRWYEGGTSVTQVLCSSGGSLYSVMSVCVWWQVENLDRGLGQLKGTSWLLGHMGPADS